MTPKKYTKYADIPQFKSATSGYAVDTPIDYLERWVEEMQKDGLDLNPPFQRGHVWTEAQQIAYVEFLLRGGVSGRDLYFNCPSWHHPVPDGAYNAFVCVDGLQRITAILRFLCDEIPAFGTFASQYEDRKPIMLSVRVHIQDFKDEREVLEWYLEMNSGGTPHSDEELARVQGMLDEMA